MKRFLVLLLLLVASPAFAATYYVDGSCSLNGNGLSDAGCATSAGGTGRFNDLHSCDTRMVAGDTCLIRPGNYYRAWSVDHSNDVGRDRNPTFQPTNSGTVGNVITYKAFDPANPPQICSAPGCSTTECNFTNSAIGTYGQSNVVFDGLRIIGNISIDGNNITIKNCNISGGWTWKNYCYDQTPGEPDGNWTGIRLNGVTGVLIQNNYVHDIIQPAPDRGSGIKAFLANNVTVEYNTIYNTVFPGIELKDGVSNFTIRYNRLIRTAYNGGEPAIQGMNQANVWPGSMCVGGTSNGQQCGPDNTYYDTNNDGATVCPAAGHPGSTNCREASDCVQGGGTCTAGGGGFNIHHNIIACGTPNPGETRPSKRLLNVAEWFYPNYFQNNTVYNCASIFDDLYGVNGNTRYTLLNNILVSTGDQRYGVDIGRFGSGEFHFTNMNYNVWDYPRWRFNTVANGSHTFTDFPSWQAFWQTTMGQPTFETASHVTTCSFLNPGLTPTADFHLVAGSTCTTYATSDAKLPGAYTGTSDCLGYGCLDIPTPPPIGTDYYVRTDGNDTTCGGLADDSRANAATLKTSCTDTNGDGVIQSTEPCTACAYATVGKCASTVTAPGRCNIKPGTYTEVGIIQANSGALVNSALRTDCTCTNGGTTVTCGGTIPTAAFGQFVKCATGPYFSWSRVLSNNGSTLTLSEPYRGDTSSSPGADTLALANFIEIKGTGSLKSDVLITSWVNKPSDVNFTAEAGTGCVYSYTKSATTNTTWAAPYGFRDKNTTWDTWRLNSNGRDAYVGVGSSYCPCSYPTMLAQLDELPGTWSDGFCTAGTNINKPCSIDGDCPSSTCNKTKSFVHTRRVCSGGTMAGYSCLGDADCLGGGVCGSCAPPATLTMQAAMGGYLFTSNRDYTIVDNLTFERGVTMPPTESKIDQQAVRLGGNHSRYSNLDILTGELGIVPQTTLAGAATSATLYSGIRAMDSTWCTMDTGKQWSGLKFYNIEIRGGTGNLMQCNNVRGISTTDRVIFDRIYAHRNFTSYFTNSTNCGAGNVAEWDCSTHYWAASGERQYRGNHGIYNVSDDVVTGQYADHIMFRNSIVDETSDGVQFGGGGNATDIWFVNNTFGAYENANISHRLQALFGCRTGTGCGALSGGAAKLYNNLFYQKQAGYFSGPWIGRYAQTDPTLIVSDYNYFLEPNLNETPGEDRVWTLSSPVETLSYVRSTYSQEANSIMGCSTGCATRGWGANYFDLAGFTGLTDVTVRDGTPTNYTPLTGFKGIDAGNVTYGTYEDFYGHVRSGTPDIGAVEYLGTGPVCGNGVKEGSELCDPGPPQEDLGGQTCISIGYGFTGGTLHCNASCNAWNTSLCTGPVSNPRTGLSGAKLSGGSIK